MEYVLPLLVLFVIFAAYLLIRPYLRKPLSPSQQVFRFCPQCAHELVERAFEGKKRQACPACTYVRWNNPVPVVVVLVPMQTEQGLGLLLIERKYEPGAGALACPGGFLDPEDNSPEEGAEREALEEASVTVKVGKVPYRIKKAPGKNQIILFYLAQPCTQTPKAGSDANKVVIAPAVRIPFDRIAFPTHRQVIEEWLADNGITQPQGGR